MVRQNVIPAKMTTAELINKAKTWAQIAPTLDPGQRRIAEARAKELLAEVERRGAILRDEDNR